MTKAFIVLRNVLTASADHGNRKYPQVPGSYDIRFQSNDWLVIYPNGTRNNSEYFFARLMAESGSQGAWIAAGAPSVLRPLSGSSVKYWTVAELRADDGVAATAIKNAWKDERPSGSLGDIIGLYTTVAGHNLVRSLEILTQSIGLDE